MKVMTLKRWGDLKKGQKWVLVGSVIIALLVLYAFWQLVFGDEPFSQPTHESVPVQVQPESQSIYFSAEVVKPLPNGGDYFVNYRLQREASRQEAKTMLAPLLDSNVVKTREEAQEKWLQLSHKIQKEEEIENLLKISGIKDAIADFGNNEVAVIVYAPNLEGSEIKVIQDIVFRVTNTAKEQVRIAYRY
ncbi:SpoIIIAH-like family protein [Desulfitobacterium hafniense]|uniref:SpoIIIAH-like family protein n=1 Tax=Desulfitobacterium hafniense TaxID=49338 RepID=UPI000372A470|nr:SpoIIIAH-like family protein [Desulfitobacterium hafniense]